MTAPQQWQKLTLAQYVHRRNGIPLGDFGSLAFFFTPWFFLLGTGVVVGCGLNMNFSERSSLVRAGINLTYILGCLALTLVFRQLFAIP